MIEPFRPALGMTLETNQSGCIEFRGKIKMLICDRSTMHSHPGFPAILSSVGLR